MRLKRLSAHLGFTRRVAVFLVSARPHIIFTIVFFILIPLLGLRLNSSKPISVNKIGFRLLSVVELASDFEKQLVNEGYMLIESRYTGRCTRCDQSYQVGDRVYWKREEGRTYVVCPKCYSGKGTLGKTQVTCPYCGKGFEITNQT